MKPEILVNKSKLFVDMLSRLKKEKAEREVEQQNMVREQVQEPVEPQPTYSNNEYYAQ